MRLAIDQAGGGEPLVLIHGLATSRQIWNAVVPALSQKRRVVTLDVPGFGESEPVGTQSGVRGMVEDYLVYSRPWGFSPGEVASEVQLWHGVDDPLVPIEHALQLAIAIPRCRVFFDPDEGHHFFRRRLRTILALLVGREQHAGEGVATTIDGARELARGGSARERRKTSVGSSADVRAS